MEILLFFCSCLFKSRCIKGIAELANLSVEDLVTTNFSLKRVFAKTFFLGNMSLVASFFVHFIAKDKDNLFRLVFKVSNPHK